MFPPLDAIRTDGDGPDVVFIHGTGRTRSNIPVSFLRTRARVTAYDRRGTARWPLENGTALPRVEDHAADAGDVIRRLSSGPAHICGMSFGGLVALEVVRQRPDLVKSLVLFEPPVPAALVRFNGSPISSTLLSDFTTLIHNNEPEKAAELFHRRALSDAAWERLPPETKHDLRGMSQHIFADLEAKASYRICERDLGTIMTPVLLLYGGRSRANFAEAIGALACCLPRARVACIACAGHTIDQLAWGEFAATLFEFIDQTSHSAFEAQTR